MASQATTTSVPPLPDAIDAIKIRCRSDRRGPNAVVTILCSGDAPHLRTVRVILDLALRAGRRERPQVTISVTPAPRTPR